MTEGDLQMKKVTLTMTTIGIAALSFTVPAQAGSSDVVAGLAGYGIGAILGGALAPQAVYVAPPPPPVYYGAVIYGGPAYRYRYHKHRHR